jgi:cation/acetate symporter
MTRTGADVAFEHRLHRRYAVFAAGLAAFVLAFASVEGRIPRALMGAAFLLATVGVYATIGLFSRTTDLAEYYVAGRRVPAMYNGMATAADWMSAASFIGLAGVIFLHGHLGLAYVIGWTGGYVLVGLLVAPYLRRFGQFTLPDFIAARYGGVLPRLIAVLAAVVVSFVYVVVQIYGVGLITSHLSGLSFEVGILVGLGGVLVCSFLGGMRAVTWTQVAQYIVLIVAYIVPVFWLSAHQIGFGVPHWSYRVQLERVTTLEHQLRADPAEREVAQALAKRASEAQDKLADVPASMKLDAQSLAMQLQAMKQEDAPLARIQQTERRLAQLPRGEGAARAAYERQRDDALARAQPLGGIAPQAPAPAPGGERRNFLALVLCLMLGTAAMPHVLTRYYTTRSVAEARRSVAWSLLFIVLLYASAPALAVIVKHEVLTNLVGMPFDELPGWIRRWSRLDASLVSVDDINGDRLLQLGELRLGADLVVLAAPEIGGLPYVVTCLVAAGGLAAALSTADGLLLTIANALSHDLYYRVVNTHASATRRVMLSKMLVLVTALLAAWVASLRVVGVLPFVTAAFSLAASAFFPTLVLGVFWRGATRAGAVLAMLAGLVTCIWYMVTNMPAMRELFGIERPLEQTRWWDIDAVSAGVFGVPVGAAVLVVASLIARRRDAENEAFVEGLHRPALPD